MEWCMKQDKLSVHVGINHRLGLVYRQKRTPSLIRLGKEHTRLFWRECGFSFIPKRGTGIECGGVVWVQNCWCYKSRALIPMRFNDPHIHGIAVESEPKRKAPDFSDAF